MYIESCEQNTIEAREALYDEIRARTLARRDWARLLRLLRVTVTLVTLFSAGLILNYEIDILGDLGVTFSFSDGAHRPSSEVKPGSPTG